MLNELFITYIYYKSLPYNVIPLTFKGVHIYQIYEVSLWILIGFLIFTNNYVEWISIFKKRFWGDCSNLMVEFMS